MSPEKRLQTKFNGEAVAEVEIKASHLTICHVYWRPGFETHG